MLKFIMAIAVISLCAYPTIIMAQPAVGPSGPVGPTYSPPSGSSGGYQRSFFNRESKSRRQSKAANKKGIAYCKNKDYDNAIKYFEKSIKLEDHPTTRKNLRMAYNWKGKEYSKSGDWDNAIRCHTEALRVDPGNEQTLHLLSVAGNKKKEQMAAASRRLEQQRYEAEKRKREEKERLERQKLKEAKQKVNSMLDGLATKFGDSTGASNSSGQSGLSLMESPSRLFEKGTKNSAPVDIRLIPQDKPLVENPKDVKGELSLLKPGDLSGKEDLPRDDRHTDELVKEKALKHKHVGDFLIQRGEYEAAESELQKALDLRPYDEDTRQSLLDLYGKQVPKLVKEDRLEEAYVQFSKAVALDPNDVALRKRVDEFGAKLGYPPLTIGGPPQTPSTDNAETRPNGEMGFHSQGAGKLTGFEGMVPERRIGGMTTTPVEPGNGDNTNIGRLQAIVGAATGDKETAGRGFDNNIVGQSKKPLDIPDVQGTPVKTQDVIVPNGFENNINVVRHVNFINNKNREIRNYEKELEELKKDVKYPVENSIEGTVQINENIKNKGKQITAAIEEKKQEEELLEIVKHTSEEQEQFIDFSFKERKRE